MTQRRCGSGGAVLLLLCAGLLVPTMVWAHQLLLGTTPSQNSTETRVPPELRLRFNEPVQLSFTRLELIGPDGARVPVGDAYVPSDENTVLVVPIDGLSAAGEYVVQWATASRDGHPVRGEFRFTIAEGAAGLPSPQQQGGEFGAQVTAPGQPDPPAAHHPEPRGGRAFEADAPAYVAIRWINFVALFGVIGAASFRLLVMRNAAVANVETSVRWAGTMGFAFAALALASALARLYAQSVAMHGAADALDVERIVTLVSRTVWGWGWLMQLAASAAAVPLFAAARRDRRGAWVGAGLAAVVLSFTPALSGHAAAMSGWLGAAAIATDVLHVLGAGVWLGTLLVLAVAGVPALLSGEPGRGRSDVAAMVRAFSPVALMGAGVLVASGIAAVFIHVSSIAALLSSRYGVLLLIKLAMVAVVFTVGAFNYLRIQPALPSAGATRRLRFSAAAELGAAAVVLVVTAVLVATARPNDDAPPSARGEATPAGITEPTVDFIQPGG